MMEEDIRKLLKLIVGQLWALTNATEETVHPDYAMKLMEHLFPELETLSEESKIILGDVLQKKIDAHDSNSEFFYKMKMSLNLP